MAGKRKRQDSHKKARPKQRSSIPPSPKGTRSTMYALLMEGMRGASGRRRFVLTMFGAVTFFSLFVFSALMVAARPDDAMWAFWGFIGSFIVSFALGLSLQPQAPLRVSADAAVQVWSRRMIKHPPQGKEMAHIEQILEELHKEAVEYLQVDQEDLTKDDIRAHIFVPEYRRAFQDGVCKLVMPKQWQVNMAFWKDRDMELYAGEGVAGYVYKSQKKRTVILVPTNGSPAYSNGIDGIEFRDSRKQKIPDELCWICDIPLKHLKGRNIGDVLGVLGIHGMRHPIRKRVLDRLPAQLTGKAAELCGALSRLPMVRVTLTEEIA